MQKTEKIKPFSPQIARLRAALDDLKKKQTRVISWARRLNALRRISPELATLRELARRAGTDEATLNRWIHGARAPDWPTIERIDRALSGLEAEVRSVDKSGEKPEEKAGGQNVG